DHLGEGLLTDLGNPARSCRAAYPFARPPARPARCSAPESSAHQLPHHVSRLIAASTRRSALSSTRPERRSLTPPAVSISIRPGVLPSAAGPAAFTLSPPGF